jgi:signal transduction histidine kinase
VFVFINPTFREQGGDAAYRFVLVFGLSALAAALLAGVLLWFALGQASAPLKTISETVDQINHAGDLSRRVVLSSSANDEVVALAGSINQTLERLENVIKSQQRLLADVSHELRTPLTVIQASVDLIRRMKNMDEDTLTSIRQEVSRLGRLVGGLLLIAQSEAGSLSLEFKPVELDLLLTEVFYEMQILAGQRTKIHLNEIDQVQVVGDRDRLKQVFLNLAANAIQYTSQDGDVFLSLASVKGFARVIVRDTGPGISPEDLPHIFERFYRAEKSRSGVSGFGLGLSIAHWIVEKHGGKIEADSKEGRGTTFAVWLPLSS